MKDPHIAEYHGVEIKTCLFEIRFYKLIKKSHNYS